MPQPQLFEPFLANNLVPFCWFGVITVHHVVVVLRYFICLLGVSCLFLFVVVFFPVVTIIQKKYSRIKLMRKYN